NWLMWLLKREVALKVGGMSDYGSPHLTDHALLAMCSRFGGGVFFNKMYSELFIHDKNFSKSNFELYYIACKGFYKLITDNFEPTVYNKGGMDALKQHLEEWFISNSFNLMKYFTYENYNRI